MKKCLTFYFKVSLFNAKFSDQVLNDYDTYGNVHDFFEKEQMDNIFGIPCK